VVNYARRIAAHARDLAAKEQNAQRRAELQLFAAP
jgi:formate C-acetyltransferase